MIRFYSAMFFRQGEKASRNMSTEANMTVDEAIDFLKQHKVVYTDTYGFIPVTFEEI